MTEFKSGDIVTLKLDALYFTGQQIAPWVKNLAWRVKSISGTRVVLGDSEDGHYTLNAPVDSKYLIIKSD